MVYRYNFPSIDTYTAFVGANSLTNIVNNTFAFAQEANLISYTEITGDVVVKGDLTVENIILGSTNLITEINGLEIELSGKQNILTQGTNITIDENNVISSSGGGSINQSELDLKQNILNDITQNSIKAHRLDLSNLHMNPGIFYYNGVSIDDMIGAKQNKFTEGTDTSTNTLRLRFLHIAGGIFYQGSSIENLFYSKQDILTNTTDLTVNSFVCNSLKIQDTFIGTLLDEKQPLLTTASPLNVASLTVGGEDIDTKIDTAVGSKQNILNVSSQLLIGALDVSSSGFIITSAQPGQITCNSLLLGGENIRTIISDAVTSGSGSDSWTYAGYAVNLFNTIAGIFQQTGNNSLTFNAPKFYVNGGTLIFTFEFTGYRNSSGLYDIVYNIIDSSDAIVNTCIHKFLFINLRRETMSKTHVVSGLPAGEYYVQVARADITLHNNTDNEPFNIILQELPS